MHLSDDDPLDRYDERDTLDDPLDDGTLPLAPGQFDPLCELRGLSYPQQEYDAAYEDAAYNLAVVNESVY